MVGFIKSSQQPTNANKNLDHEFINSLGLIRLIWAFKQTFGAKFKIREDHYRDLGASRLQNIYL